MLVILAEFVDCLGGMRHREDVEVLIGSLSGAQQSIKGLAAGAPVSCELMTASIAERREKREAVVEPKDLLSRRISGPCKSPVSNTLSSSQGYFMSNGGKLSFPAKNEE
jgi:hypothetical protein